MRSTSGLPTNRELAPLINTRAFVGTNPMDEPIPSGSPLIRPEFSSAVQRDSELLGWALAKINFGLDRQ
jgi:hypothetical protein